MNNDNKTIVLCVVLLIGVGVLDIARSGVKALEQYAVVQASSTEALRGADFQNGVMAGAAVGMAQCAKSEEGKQLWLNLLSGMQKDGLIRDQALIDRMLKETK